MVDISGNSNTDSYKSPVRKLVQFFKKSRNQWKVKCQEAKYLEVLLKIPTKSAKIRVTLSPD